MKAASRHDFPGGRAGPFKRPDSFRFSSVSAPRAGVSADPLRSTWGFFAHLRIDWLAGSSSRFTVSACERRIGPANAGLRCLPSGQERLWRDFPSPASRPESADKNYKVSDGPPPLGIHSASEWRRALLLQFAASGQQSLPDFRPNGSASDTISATASAKSRDGGPGNTSTKRCARIA